MLEVFAAIVMLSMLSGTPNERREQLKPLLGLTSRPRWNFYVIFTRSWYEDVCCIMSNAIPVDSPVHKRPVTEYIAEDILMREPGTPLIRRAIRQLHLELTEIHTGAIPDWRADLNATFDFLDSWGGEVDELGGDRYHLAAKISIDAPDDTEGFEPINWFVQQMTRLYGWNEHPFGPELAAAGGEFDIVGHEVAGTEPAWVPLSSEEIDYIEGRELLGNPLERDHRGSRENWTLFHKDMWDQISEQAKGRFVTPEELDAVAHSLQAS